MRVNRKRHNRVCIVSSKHIYRPMGARVVAQLFYSTLQYTFIIHFSNTLQFTTRHLNWICLE